MPAIRRNRLPRPLSQLVYSNIQQASTSPLVITLHDHNQFGPDVAEWGTAAAPDGSVIALESYKGVFMGKDIVGYTWFLGPNTAPSPIFFGDSLQEIERFLWDVNDRSGDESPILPYLIGVGQGGIMAIAAGLAVPDLLSGVIAIDAFLPEVGGWDPPLAPMNHLPMLLVNPVRTGKQRVLEGDKLVSQLTLWEADVTTVPSITDPTQSTEMATWIRAHGSRRLASVSE